MLRRTFITSLLCTPAIVRAGSLEYIPSRRKPLPPGVYDAQFMSMQQAIEERREIIAELTLGFPLEVEMVLVVSWP